MKLVIFLLCSFISLNLFAIDSEMVARVQKVIDQQTDQMSAVGITVGLFENGERVILSSGLKDLKNKVSMTGDELFSIGSVSKTFTSLLLSNAVVEGMVSIDAKVKEILPELDGVRAGDVTLRELSTHSSGMMRDPKKFISASTPFKDYTRENLIKELRVATFSEMGDTSQYSNLGIALLGISLEKIYGESFEDALMEHVLVPLGLHDIKVEISEDELLLMPKKYSDAFVEKPIWKSLGVFNPAGSIKASASSMLDYLEAQLEPKRTKLRQAIENSQKILHEYKGYNLGYGWFVFNNDNVDTYWHNGSTSGFLTDAYYIPEQGKALIILNNSGSKIECVTQIFFKGEECTPTKIILDRPETLTELAGVYTAKAQNMSFKIEKTDYGYMTLMLIGQNVPTRLYKKSTDSYDFLMGAGSVKFTRDDKGVVKEILFSQSGSTFKAQKQ